MFLSYKFFGISRDLCNSIVYGVFRMVKSQVVLSVEQPLTMTYATLRLVHLGLQVIKLEPTPMAERKSKADSAYIGRQKNRRPEFEQKINRSYPKRAEVMRIPLIYPFKTLLFILSIIRGGKTCL